MNLRLFIYCGSYFPGSCFFYCGLEVTFVDGVGIAAGGELAGVIGAAVGGDGWEVAGAFCDFGGSGVVVIALSGLSRWSLLGPSPKLISARESGTVLLCHP